MTKFLFRGIFSRIDMIVFGILMLLSSDFDNPFLILIIIPLAGISGIIEKRFVRDKDS